MNNDTGSGIFNKYSAVSVRFSVLVYFSAHAGLMPLAALADTGLPPPAVHQTTQNSFPSSQALQRQGYDPNRGVLRVQDTNQGRPTVTSNGGTITGTQKKTVTVTGKYGEKGVIQTGTTQTVNTGKIVNNLAKFGAFAAGIANAQSFDNGQMSNFIKNGDYGGAINQAVLNGGAFLDGFFTGGLAGNAISDYSFSKFGDSVNTAELAGIAGKARQGQAAAEKAGDFAGAVGNAAVAKAAEGAAAQANAEQKLNDAKQRAKQEIVYQVVVGSTYYIDGKPKNETKHLSVYTNQQFQGMSSAVYEKNGNRIITQSSPLNEYLPASLPGPGTASAYRVVVSDKTVPPSISSDDINISGSEVEQILKRMLESQQTNHQELMNQLAKIGDAVQNATTNQEWTAKTATTEPYTPAGSDTPQQTQFSIDQNGNITAKTILRPDLKPNSSQAPMRTEVIKNPNAQSQTQQNGQQQQGEQGQNQQGQQQNQQGQQQNQQGQNTNQTGQQQNQTGQQTGQTGQTTATTGQNAQQQNQQQQNFCQQNPRAAACAELGEADYEDLEIPENAIDLKLEPMDIFSTDGTCPSNPTFSVGALGTFEIPYQYLCDVARLIRPILILSTIIGCGFFAYSAVREL